MSSSPDQPDSPLAPRPRHVEAIYDADSLGGAELDALPYGMMQLDERGTVLRYSSVETRMSGLSAEECVGRDFFNEVAPCTHVTEFYGRFLEGVAHKSLDTRFRFTFAFRPPRVVDVHMFYSKVTSSMWVRVQDAGA